MSRAHSSSTFLDFVNECEILDRSELLYRSKQRQNTSRTRKMRWSPRRFFLRKLLTLDRKSLPATPCRQSLLLYQPPSPSIDWNWDIMQQLCDHDMFEQKPSCSDSATIGKGAHQNGTLIDASLRLIRCESKESLRTNSSCLSNRTITTVPSLSSSQGSCSTLTGDGDSYAVIVGDLKLVAGVRTHTGSCRAQPAMHAAEESSTNIAVHKRTAKTYDVLTVCSVQSRNSSLFDSESYVARDTFSTDLPVPKLKHYQPQTSEVSFMDWDSDGDDDDIDILQPLSKVNAMVKKSIIDLRMASKGKTNILTLQSEQKSIQGVQTNPLGITETKRSVSILRPRLHKVSQQRSYTYPIGGDSAQIKAELVDQKRSTIAGCENLSERHEKSIMKPKELDVQISPYAGANIRHAQAPQNYVSAKLQPRPQLLRRPYWTSKMRCS